MVVNNYLRLVKFSHTLFALPFAVASFFLAWRHSGEELSWWLLMWVVLAVVLARNTAMAFNRYADRRFDAENPRTRAREIPVGVIRPWAALTFVVANGLLFMIVAWMINPLCFALSPVALMVILGYSLTKRFTALCHLILGTGLALAPLGAWLAVTGQFHPLPILIAIAVLLWVAGFDIIYALQDEEYDTDAGLKSIPSAIGRKRALLISVILHTGSFVSITAASLVAGFQLLALTGTGIFGVLLIYQHLIISEKNLSKINIAFFTTNGVASIIWAMMVVLESVIC
jgi:4-hydroxybenzoate polyprenyltransferase